MHGHSVFRRSRSCIALIVALVLALFGSSFAVGQLSEIEGRLRFVGRIVDAQGEPVPDAIVRVMPSGLTLRSAGFVQREYWGESGAVVALRYVLNALRLGEIPKTVSSTDGRFSLEVPHVPLAAEYPTGSDGTPWPVLVVEAPGRATWVAGWTSIDHHWQEELVDVGDIVLQAEVAVTGRFVDQLGEPVAGVELLLWTHGIAPGYAPDEYRPRRLLYVPELMSTTSAPDGRFRLGGLWPGSMTIVVGAPDHVSRELEPTVESPGTHDLGDIVLEAGHSVSGVVVGPAGQPVPHAEVFVTGRKIQDAWVQDMQFYYGQGRDTIHDELRQVRLARRPPARTDETGSFRISGIDGLNLSVYVWAPGLEPSRTEEVGVDGDPLRIQLQAEGRLVVHVVEAGTGLPIPGATLRATRLMGHVRYTGGDAPLMVVPATDGGESVPGAEPVPPSERAGAFLVRGAGFVGQRLDVAAEGYATLEHVAPGVAPGESRAVTIELQPESSLGGEVVDSNGEPVPGAYVYLTEPGVRRRSLATTQADAHGSYAFRGLAALRAMVYAWSPGFAESRSVFVALADAGTRDDVRVVLPPAARIQGRVLDPDGEPLVSTYVTLDDEPFGADKYEQRSGRWEGFLRTDTEGRYEFGGLAAGAYRVESPLADTVRLELTAGERRELDLRTRRAKRARGRVTSGSGGIEGVEVRAKQKSWPDGERRYRYIDRVRTSADGSYDLELGGPGTYELQARLREGARSDVQLIDATGSEEVVAVDFQLGDGLVTGRVIRDDNGLPIESLEMVLSTEQGDYLTSCKTDALGHYAFRHLSPGRYVIRASGSGATEAVWHGPLVLPLEDHPITIQNNEVREDVDFQVCPGARLSGSVTQLNGLPPKDGMTVLLMYIPESEPLSKSEHTTVKDGAFAFGPLPAGDYRVLAGAGGVQEVLESGVPVHLTEHATEKVRLIARP